MILDRAELAKLPADSKKVEVLLKNDVLTVKNDGSVVTNKTVD